MSETDQVSPQAEIVSVPSKIVFEQFDEPITIARLQEEVHENARNHGWWDEARSPAELLCLVHSEVSEALEEVRDNQPVGKFRLSVTGKPEGFGVELADAIIRICDFAEFYGINLTAMLRVKMQYNLTRPFKHNKAL
jgi:NTP pyrophosphatase (non-canonical NTP hydrolase)